MFRFFALVLALSAVGYAEVRESDVLADRIVGGSSAEISEFPWQLSLRFLHAHVCGASLISPIWAVSAAHCTINRAMASLSLLAGNSNRLAVNAAQLRVISMLINHPEYDSSTINHDISLLRVSIAFTINANVRLVSLPYQGEFVRPGAYGVVSGWGSVREGGSLVTILQQVWVPVVDQAICNAAYFGRITDEMLCAGYLAGGRDACQGDSGGPYVVDGKLVGIVSWGTGCARPDFPGVYARVPVYRDWIRANTGV